MRRFIVVACSLLFVGLFSCTKDWRCECVVSGGIGSSNQSHVKIIKDSKKKDAKSACDEFGEQSKTTSSSPFGDLGDLFGNFGGGMSDSLGMDGLGDLLGGGSQNKTAECILQPGV
ncbi:MAG: hypothetical protein H3C31_11980 [Brumimicrobium sp.]|nr:hypothetical protein [Brumimicrobium sp.]